MKNNTKWQIFKKKLIQIRTKRENFALFITCISVIMVWRGVWTMLDLYLFPTLPFVSAIFSTTI